MTSHPLAFSRRTAFGTVAGVLLPPEVDDAALSELLEPERALALSFEGHRRIAFVGGRLAFARACEAAGVARQPLLSGPRGEPLSPPGLSVSLTHKRALAVALVGNSAEGTVGIDLEGGDGRERLSIASRVLRPEELEVFHALPEGARWPHLKRSFALKEAVYKAIHPHLQRYVGFSECRLEFNGDAVAVTMLLAHGETLPPLMAWAEWLDGDQLLAYVRAVCLTPPPALIT